VAIRNFFCFPGAATHRYRLCPSRPIRIRSRTMPNIPSAASPATVPPTNPRWHPTKNRPSLLAPIATRQLFHLRLGRRRSKNPLNTNPQKKRLTFNRHDPISKPLRRFPGVVYDKMAQGTRRVRQICQSGDLRVAPETCGGGRKCPRFRDSRRFKQHD